MAEFDDYPGVRLGTPDDLADELRNLRTDELAYIALCDGEIIVGTSTQSADDMESMLRALEEAIELIAV